MACDCEGCVGCGICTVCTGSCGSGCQQNCTGGCQGSCLDGCGNDCQYSCYQCTTQCVNGCYWGCQDSCQDGCYTSCKDGCYTGCYGCRGTCSNYCNTGCNTTGRSTVIANLGTSIITNSFETFQDLINLRDELHNEIIRRNYSAPSDSFSVTPTSNAFITKEHFQKSLDDANLLFGYGYKTDSITTNPYKAVNASTDVIKASDLANVITYCKELMGTVVPK